MNFYTILRPGRLLILLHGIAVYDLPILERLSIELEERAMRATQSLKKTLPLLRMPPSR